MRKLTEPQAHRGRVAIIEGRFPEGMQARCAWCGKVEVVNEGEMVDTDRPGSGPSRIFRCASCSEKYRAA
ncbi:MAG: hypothetical protein QOG54_778 [Actinomycetota bacterium]|jgi:hypothetical protein|nr:hypothetical protein [Actinomycetota bacterium]